MTGGRLKIVLCWHLHEAWSWDPLSARYVQPWTYLHAIRDYIDTLAHIESVPGARAVLNFTPTLLEQLSDYESRIALSLASGIDIGDPVLDALRAGQMPVEPLAREPLLKVCLGAHEQHQIARHPPYARLAELARRCLATPDIHHYLNGQFVADLLVWFHLGWLAESVRGDARVERLLEKSADFTHEDRMELLGLIGELIAGIVSRCRRLAARGQVELSVTPYAHPIAPLLIDFTSAREAVPAVSLPSSGAYPGGVERARWHIDKAVLVFAHVFGTRPEGLWPAEGALSMPLLALLDEFGFRWDRDRPRDHRPFDSTCGGQLPRAGRSPGAGRQRRHLSPRRRSVRPHRPQLRVVERDRCRRRRTRCDAHAAREAHESGDGGGAGDLGAAGRGGSIPRMDASSCRAC